MSKPKPMIHVHNHGPEEGPGYLCTEHLVGECQVKAMIERLNKLEAMIGKIALILREEEF